MFLYILRVIFVREEKKKREMKHRVAIKINKYRWANKKNKKKRGGGRGEGETRYDFRGYKGTKACLAYLKSVTVELLKWWRRQWWCWLWQTTIGSNLRAGKRNRGLAARASHTPRVFLGLLPSSSDTYTWDSWQARDKTRECLH